MSPKIERLDSIQRFGIGEGPHWEQQKQALYLADLTTGTIACWRPETDSTIYQNVGSHSSFMIPVKGKRDEFVVSSQLELLHIKWDVEANKLLKKETLIKLKDTKATKINDAKCDVKGRLWFGTWNDGSKPDGEFYSFTKSKGLVKHESSIYISNGIGFSPDNKKMYYTDTFKYKVNQYKVDPDNGTREFEKTVLDFKESGVAGAPDGLTVDKNGYLWVACVFGSQVIQLDPDSGKILQKVVLPNCTQPTSVTFGGPQWDEMYITSANIKDFSQAFKDFKSSDGAPEAGATYKVTELGAIGVPPFEFDMNL